MDIFVTVVLQDLGKNGWGVYIPDRNMTLFGKDRISAMSDAIQTLRAIRYYNIHNGVELEATVTTEDALKYCKSANDFVTVVAVSLV